jgi:cell division protease FtsH
MGILLPGVSETSPETQRLVDEEVRRIVDSAYREVLELLRDKRGNLDDLVAALLSAETLDEAEAYAAAGVTRESASGEDRRPVAALLPATRADSSGIPDGG